MGENVINSSHCVQVDYKELATSTIPLWLIKISLYLPVDVCIIIKEIALSDLKQGLRIHNLVNFGRGVSKSAGKRRAQKLERCFKCGKFSHSGICPKNQTYSQSSFVSMFRSDPIKLKAEKTLGQETSVKLAVDELCLNIKSKLKSRTRERL